MIDYDKLEKLSGKELETYLDGVVSCYEKKLQETKDLVARYKSLKPEQKYKGCKVEGCEEIHHGKGFCSMHYWRNKNNGSPDIVQRKGPTMYQYSSLEEYSLGKILVIRLMSSFVRTPASINPPLLIREAKPSLFALYLFISGLEPDKAPKPCSNPCRPFFIRPPKGLEPLGIETGLRDF